MSQKSSVPQAVSFVSQALKRDTPRLEPRIDQAEFYFLHRRLRSHTGCVTQVLLARARSQPAAKSSQTDGEQKRKSGSGPIASHIALEHNVGFRGTGGSD